ncbi:MAG TPA: flagellar basal body P-ring formation chaperone FlgA [Candidatus Cybelea sp.]|nr:flagellar basal body P-ring formation chaperone FlgA [Candidatus Cybelea sp.]
MIYRLLITGVFVLLLAIAAIAEAAFGATADEASSAPAAPIVSARLRASVVVVGDRITLGDLFDNAGKAADVVAAAAPPPGEKVYLRVSQIQAVTEAAGLTFEPDPGLRTVAVTRAGRLVPHQEIVAQIAKALADYTEGGDVSVQLSNQSLTISVPTDAQASVRVDDIDYDPRSQRFVAILAAPADDANASHFQVQGRLISVSRVPGLRSRINPGHVIAKSDIEWIEVPVERIDRYVVTDPDDLIGKTPKRSIAPGSAIRSSDVDRPLLVAKGAIVTMTMTVPNMTLTTVGRAMDNGGKGDVIQVQNVQSSKSVAATVSGPNQVVVGAVGPLAALPSR